MVTKRQGETGEFVKVSRRILTRRQEESLTHAEDIDVIQKKSAATDSTPMMSTTLKSRRDLIAAIKGGKPLRAINQLYVISLVVLLCVITLASTEYGLFTVRYNSVVDNLRSFSTVSDLKTEISRAVLNTRTIVLLQANRTIDMEKYATKALYTAELKVRLLAIQARIDTAQKLMSNLAKSNSRLNNILISDRSLSVLFRVSNASKSETYSLLESILILNSYIIKLANRDDLTQVDDTDESVYFIRQNGLNSIFIRLETAFDGLKQDLKDYSSRAKIDLMIVLICSCVIVFAGSVSVVPFLRSVSTSKEEILLLFFKIKRTYAKMFVKKCQAFYNSLQKKKDQDESGDEASDKMVDDEEEGGDKEKDDLLGAKAAQSYSSVGVVESKRSSAQIYGIIIIQVVIALALGLYFILSYIFFVYYLMDTFPILTQAMHSVGYATSSFEINYLAMRETMLQSDWTIESRPPLNATLKTVLYITKAEEAIKSFYSLDTGNVGMYFGDFATYISDYLQDSLCTDEKDTYFTTNHTKCESFIYTIPKNVLLSKRWIGTASSDVLCG